MNTSSRAIKKKNLAASSSPVAASSSAYSFRERPTKKDLAKSKSSVYPKVQNLEKAPTESSSPMMNPRNGDTGNKNPERDVNASATSSPERPKEDDLSIYRLRKLQNRETSSNSKTPVTSTTHHGRPVVATSSSVVNSENNGTVKKKRGRPPGVSSSTYSSRKRPLQNDKSKSGSSRKKAPTVSSSLFNSSNNGTVKKKRGRPAAATISSSYSLRQRPKKNVTAKSKKSDSSNQETDTVSESDIADMPKLEKNNISVSHMNLESDSKETGEPDSEMDDMPKLHNINGSESEENDDMSELLKNNVSESGMDGEIEPEKEDELEMGDAFDQMDDIHVPDDVFQPENDTVFEQKMERISDVMEEDVDVSANSGALEPMDDIYMPEETDVIQVLIDNVSPSDTASAPNDNVFEQKMEGITQVMEEDVAVSSNNGALKPMDDISKNSNLPEPIEKSFDPEENDVSQGLNDNVSQPEKDTVSASLSDNAANPKKDDGTTQSSFAPKSKSFNVAEMRAMFAECDADKFKMYQRMYRMETQVIKNAYRLKYIALRTAANPSDMSVFTEPPVEFEVKERDRIFSGTFSAFQPKNIFESSDEEDAN